MTSRAPLNGSNGQPPQANGASNARADGRLVLGMAPWDALRYAAVDVTTAVQIARRRHDLGPLAAVALGRTMAAAALLLRFTTKNPGSIRVEIQGDGPLGQVVAEFDAEGALVGHVANPHVAIGDLGEGSADGFAIGAAVG
ncbi:MAG: Hsp33 family molecular chaperone HslO, partial [Acidobacteriota bacterium]